MSFFEFPHTRKYDNDLGWLIKHMDELQTTFDSLYDSAQLKIADPINWDIATQYGEHTVVMKDGIDAYISRKPVPTGIDINNTEYWTPLSDWGNLMEETREAAERAEAAVARIYGKRDAFRDRKFLFIGDSYCKVNNSALMTNIRNYGGIPAENMIDQTISGSGFSGYTWAGILLNNVLPEADAETITDIVVIGGYNDFADLTLNPSVLYGHIRTFMQYAKQYYPNAYVTLVPVGFNINNTSAGSAIRQHRYALLPIYRRISDFGGCCVTGTEYIMCDRTIVDTDGVHPTPDGCIALATGIINALLSGGYFVSTQDTQLSAITTYPIVPYNNTINLSGNCYERFNNGMWSMKKYGAMRFTISGTPNFANSVVLFTINGRYFFSNENGTYSSAALVDLHYNGASHIMPAYLYLQGNLLVMCVPNAPTGQTYDYVDIYGFNILVNDI